MSNSFKNRVFGCAIIKSINSNYNADFSHQPRKLPNGTVYATDKVLKYSVRNYWKNVLNQKVFYFKTLDDSMSPLDLVGLYEDLFKDNQVKSDTREVILKNLLSALDVKTFGATFAPKGTGIDKKNISIHGSVQFTHGMNRFHENVIYTEQIMAPFKTPGKEGDTEAQKGNTTLGSQSKLQEGHYVHHFSVNPKNIEADVERVDAEGLSVEDIAMLKEGLRNGVTYYDSSAKSGTENELLLWVQLKEGSKLVLPSFVELVDINCPAENEREIDLGKITTMLKKAHVAPEIEKVELYYAKGITNVVNAPEQAAHLDI